MKFIAFLFIVLIFFQSSCQFMNDSDPFFNGKDNDISKIILSIKDEDKVHSSFYLTEENSFQFSENGSELKREIDLSKIFQVARNIKKKDLNRVFNVNSNDYWEFDLFLYTKNSNSAYNIRVFGKENTPTEVDSLIKVIIALAPAVPPLARPLQKGNKK